MNKYAKLFSILDDEEIDTCIYLATGLSPGDKVVHENEGKYAGSSGIINLGMGVVIDTNYQGQHFWGGHCFTSLVKWENGQEMEIGTVLLRKVV